MWEIPPKQDERILHQGVDMTKVIGIIGFAILGGVFLMVGCTEGPEGPAGPAGTTDCIQCHNDGSEIPAISGQWAVSNHAIGGNFERNGEDCALCHTNEGFQEYIATGMMISPDNPSAIGCFTCHAPHSMGDFSLRADTAVDMDEGGSFDFGTANLCANCHQARAVEPAVGDNIEVTSIRWGPHHGPQGNFLAGDLGYMAAGLDTTDPHQNADNGCVDCHMAAPYGAQAGGHTMKMAYEYHGHDVPNVAGCNTADCHDGGIDDDTDWEAGGGFNYGFVQSEVMDLMDELRVILLAEGLIDEDDYVFIPEGEDFVTFTLEQAEAVYYFRCVLEDRSHGIHNPDLTVSILEYSIGLFD